MSMFRIIDISLDDFFVSSIEAANVVVGYMGKSNDRTLLMRVFGVGNNEKPIWQNMYEHLTDEVAARHFELMTASVPTLLRGKDGLEGFGMPGADILSMVENFRNEMKANAEEAAKKVEAEKAAAEAEKTEEEPAEEPTKDPEVDIVDNTVKGE